MVGTARSRVSFFVNSFRKLGSLIIRLAISFGYTVRFSMSFSATNPSSQQTVPATTKSHEMRSDRCNYAVSRGPIRKRSKVHSAESYARGRRRSGGLRRSAIRRLCVERVACEPPGTDSGNSKGVSSSRRDGAGILSLAFLKARSTASKKFSIDTVAPESSGRNSSFDRCNQPPLAIIDPDFIPLQYLSERLVHLGVAGSVLDGSNVNLGEAAVGLRSKFFTDVIQNILHFHRTVSFLFGEPRRAMMWGTV
jgi:hypothetical protein